MSVNDIGVKIKGFNVPLVDAGGTTSPNGTNEKHKKAEQLRRKMVAYHHGAGVDGEGNGGGDHGEKEK